MSKLLCLRCIRVFLETGSKSEDSVKEEDEGETSVGQEQEQPTDSQANTPQTRVALVMAKLKAVLILFLVYGKWVLDKLIGFLNELSKDYRAVARRLKKARREKRRRDSMKDNRSRDGISESMDEDSVDAKVGCVSFMSSPIAHWLRAHLIG